MRLTGSRWIVWAARMGHVATGSVYLVVGGIALVAAFDFRLDPKGAQEALRVLVARSPGTWLLIVLATGLAADFVWQIVRAVFNVDRASVDLKGYAERLGWLISGAIHLGLAVSVVKLALAVPQRSSEHQAQASTAAAMTLPFGRWIVTAIGTVIIIVGVQLFYRAWTGDVDRWLDLRSMGRLARALILGLGRFGLAARALLFCTGGLLLASAALERHPWAARGVGGTLRALNSTAAGPVVLAAVGAGLMGFGIVELVSARYRRIALKEDHASASAG
jgi:hypothetical protein